MTWKVNDRVMLPKGSTIPRTVHVTDKDAEGTVGSLIPRLREIYVAFDAPVCGSLAWSISEENLRPEVVIQDEEWQETLVGLQRLAQR